MTSIPSPLLQLCRLHGIETEYRDMAGRLQRAEPPSLLAVLNALGAPVRAERDVPAAIRWRKEALRNPSTRRPFVLSLVEGQRPAAQGERKKPNLRESGWKRGHPASRDIPGQKLRGNRAGWGLFVPPYALHSQRSWGGGDLTDLGDFVDWAASCGADIVATLPLLSLFLDRPLEPSPYAPVSRLFWSEFWVDVTRLPEWELCRAARRLASSARFQETLARLRRAPCVDYRRQMACKREILEKMAQTFFRRGGDQEEPFQQFLRSNPELVCFARFRAAAEKTGAVRYHLYAQWAAEQQMRSLAERCRKRRVRLCLDLPLGVHPDGYDVWRWKDLFARGAAIGAPPDTFFTQGQNWGFPPLHPERIRREGYRYLRACLAHSMRLAGWLRVDHVMGLHRLFWIPRGFPPAQGVYVRYPAEELYAVIAQESQRHACAVIGEDLGTVPPEVRVAMRRYGLARMFVAQYEARAHRRRVLPTPTAGSVASLNTHDMPPFAAFWKGDDILDRRRMGLLDQPSARRERRNRRLIREGLIRWLRLKETPSPFLSPFQGERIEVRGKPAANLSPRVLGASARAVGVELLRALRASRASVVLANLEDLWGERRPQNTPGTGPQRPNWRRKTRTTLEEIRRSKSVGDSLRRIGLAGPSDQNIHRRFTEPRISESPSS